MMRRWAVLLVAFVLWSAVAAADEVVPLELIRCLPVEGPPGLQPSGLAIRDGVLYTVSDKHDSVIFELGLEEEVAVCRPAVVFEDAAARVGGHLDLEGITCDESGNFFVVSETRFRILRVSGDGREAAWVTPELRSAGMEKGLFQTPGAYLEGIALLGPDKFVLCAERQPRGLLEVDVSGEEMRAVAFSCQETRFPLPEGRSPDFTGLHLDGESLYALVRNANLICRLLRNESGYEEGPAWSYESIVNRDDLRYVDMRFGQAEGLCMDDDRVYVILDNNGMPREGSERDTRPILLIMARPKE